MTPVWLGGLLWFWNEATMCTKGVNIVKWSLYTFWRELYARRKHAAERLRLRRAVSSALLQKQTMRMQHGMRRRSLLFWRHVDRQSVVAPTSSATAAAQRPPRSVYG